MTGANSRQIPDRECRIRVVDVGDAAEIAEIYNDYIVNTTVSFEIEALDEEQMARRIAGLSASHPYFVAQDKAGHVVGFCYAHPWKERAAYSATWETTIYLRRNACGTGLGRRLMEVLTDACLRRGAHALIACITADNSNSLDFHRKIGFNEVSRFKEVGRKFNRWLDVVDMELILPRQPPFSEPPEL